MQIRVKNGARFPSSPSRFTGNIRNDKLYIRAILRRLERFFEV